MASETCIVILGAGSSKRFGSNKLQSRLARRQILDYSVASSLKSGIGDVYLVYSDAAIIPSAFKNSIIPIYNDKPDLGISASISIAVREISSHHNACLITLADQPLIPSSHFRNLIDRSRATGKGIVATRCGDRIGNPTLFGKRYFADLQVLQGDKGARQLILDNTADLEYVDMKDCRYLMDIDTAEDFKKAASLLDVLFPSGFF